MAKEFYVTNKGMEVIETAIANGTKVDIIKARFGSGGDLEAPKDLTRTDVRHLVYEKRFDPVTDGYEIVDSGDPALVIKVVIPTDIVCTVNEIGFYDREDNLIVYGDVIEEKKRAGVKYEFDCYLKFKNIDGSTLNIVIISPEVERVENLVRDTKEHFDNTLEEETTRLTGIVEDTVNQFDTKLEEESSRLEGIVDETVETFDNKLSETTTTLQDLVDKTEETFTQRITDTTNTVNELVESTENTFNQRITDTTNTVNSLVENTENTFDQRIQETTETLQELIDTTDTTFNNTLDETERRLLELLSKAEFELDINNFTSIEQYNSLLEQVELDESEFEELKKKFEEFIGGEGGGLSEYLKITDAQETFVSQKEGYDLVSDSDVAQITTNKTNIESILETIKTLATTEKVEEVIALVNKIGTYKGVTTKAELTTLKETAQVGDTYIVSDDNDHWFIFCGVEAAGKNKVDENGFYDAGNHIDLSGFVTKEEGKSLVSDTDIAQITENKNQIESLKTQVEEDINSAIQALPSINFGSEPEEPKENMVWFDTENKLVKVYIGETWEPFGAVYL